MDNKTKTFDSKQPPRNQCLSNQLACSRHYSSPSEVHSRLSSMLVIRCFWHADLQLLCGFIFFRLKSRIYNNI